MPEPLLEVKNLSVAFHTPDGALRAVRGVTLDVAAAETVALVGESGCGKTIMALGIMNLVPMPGRVEDGQVLFEGRDLLTLPAAEMRTLRGRRIAMIFQEPMTSLNPVFTIGSQIAEAILAHERISAREARDRARQLLSMVKIPEPEQRLRQYPHQLSGGMQQRVMIAMALACRPALLVADEPTTALDVTVQAEILQLLEGLKRELDMAMLIITHDLGIVAETADRVFIMYAGRMVETALVERIFKHPMHPYTAGLLAAVPRLETKVKSLQPIPGTVPSPGAIPAGCPFHPRCPLADTVCEREEPPFRSVGEQHQSACHFAESVKCPILESSS